MTAHKNKARRQEAKMIEALDRLGLARELVVDLYYALAEVDPERAAKYTPRVSCVAGELLDDDHQD